ncbi:MAG: hypothetical protein IJY08_01200 [Clostridia bacterium]|nr:hypothetical protein [Clostridia bacterium]
MSKKDKKTKKGFGQYFSLVVYLLTGAAIGFYTSSVMNSPAGESMGVGQRLLWYASLILCLYVCIFLQIIVHEGGHLIFGLASGYRFCSFRVASFMLTRAEGKVKLRRLSLAGTGGQCLMSPPDMRDGRIPYVLYNLGGVLMNTVFSAAAMLLFLLLPRVPVLSTGLVMFSLMGVAMALTNGIPLRMGAVDNDGYNAMSLGKDEAALRAFWMQLRVSEQNSHGVRLKDMPPEWFTLPTMEQMRGNSMIATVGVFACNRLMDEGRYAEADALMADMIGGGAAMVGIHKSLLICDRIWCELMGECRVLAVSDMLTKEQQNLMKAMKKFPTVIRTRYVMALLMEGDAERAESEAKQFEVMARSYPYPSDIESERELMRRARERYAEKMGNTHGGSESL